MPSGDGRVSLPSIIRFRSGLAPASRRARFQIRLKLLRRGVPPFGRRTPWIDRLPERAFCELLPANATECRLMVRAAGPPRPARTKSIYVSVSGKGLQGLRPHSREVRRRQAVDMLTCGNASEERGINPQNTL